MQINYVVLITKHQSLKAFSFISIGYLFIDLSRLFLQRERILELESEIKSQAVKVADAGNARDKSHVTAAAVMPETTTEIQCGMYFMFDLKTKFVPVLMELFGFVHGFSLLGSFLSY